MGSTFGAIWEDPEGGFIKFTVKKSFKTRPNTQYGGETSHYSILQGDGVSYFFFILDNFIWTPTENSLSSSSLITHKRSKNFRG